MLMKKSLIFTVVAMLASPGFVGAQEPTAHFAQLNLDESTLVSTIGSATNVVSGETGGSFSLTALSRYDEAGNLCSGYSYDSNLPSHILELTQPVDELSIWVNSRGQDTTLLIRGSNGVDCGDDLNPLNADAGISRKDWQPGIYQIWVGSSAPGTNYRYQLQVQRGGLPE